MPFDFRPAKREQTKLLIALAGPSGGGKTFSALSLAIGLAGSNGKIAFIDTESGRALHYAGRFKFDHGELRAPFRPEAYLAAIEAAEKARYDVIVIDSMSHEWEGAGGIVEWAGDLESRGTKSPGNWKEPKVAHKRFINRLLQCRSHLIFCLRAEEKIKIEKVYDEKKGREVTVVTPDGWHPICEKGFMFEMTASFMMPAETPGIPKPIKLQDQHKAAFPAGGHITPESGAMLGRWANGEDIAPAEASAQTAPSADTRKSFWARASLTIPDGNDRPAWAERMKKAITAAPDAGAVDKLIRDNAAGLEAYAQLDADDAGWIKTMAAARADQMRPAATAVYEEAMALAPNQRTAK